ncbi:FA complementation group M isoform X3 [Oratosquilla oratoria]|uniref:FA complementation group M isoform X3 n=1 Tax=Oratosquilla oratoria TaxID=337810 RepID=UPI003F768C3A
MDKEKQITLFSSWTHQKKSDDDSSYAQPMKDQMWGDDEILAQVLEQSLREYQSTQNSSHGEGPSHHRNTTDTEEEYGIESTPVLPPCHPLETLPGFDLDAGRTWIYPVNYPVRQYQYDIVHKSLFLNTLVALPTGLGKTFIAAVLMYNFYRWYPQGKVIFMAPTKPLVTQQVEACYNVMGIPQADTAEMTGTMNPTNRIGAWKAKRMFFLTPQVLTNDLNRGACPTANVCCIVLDEAHRAQGNHAYCQVVRELSGYGAKFRILALSATPGTDIKSVQQVIQNLQISHIELRSEDSPDIAPYTHARNIEKIVVDLGTELKRIKEYYLAIVRVHVKRLIDWRAVYTRDETTLSKFQILKAREAFRQNPPDSLPRYLYGVVEGEFALCMTLYHALELLQLHGAKSFHSFLKGTLSSDKGNNRARGELLRNSDFIQLMDYVEKKFSPEEHVNASTSHGSPGLDSKFSSPNSSKAKPGNPYVASHPKLEKLRNIILEHFKKFAREDQSTRVMIFSQYRDSVKEITDMLQDYQPQVKAMSFVGQSSVGRGARGFSQKEQLKVVKRFREGGYNTLVSTCVGEEGLDIGEVDLIICFDAPKSPIRLVQRMGRTGRKREGSIVVLVTKGKEEQTYNQSQYQKKTIHSALANGQILKKYLYPRSERMIPKGVQPVCHKLIMKVDAWDEKAGKGKKRKYASESCGSLFSSVQSGKGKRKSIASVQGNYLTHEEWNWYKENLEVSKDEVKVLPASCMIALGDVKESHGSCQIQLGEYQPWQTTHQPSHLISHSLKSQHLVELTEFMDLMVTLGPDDDSYGLEMAPFFDDKFLGGENEVAKDAGTPQKNSSPVISRAKRGRKKGMKMKGIQRRIDEVLSQHKKQKTCKDSTQEKESNESNYSNSNQRFKNALSKFACNQEEEKDFEEVNSNSKPLMSCSSEKEQKEVCQSSQRSCSDGQDFQDTAEVVTVCSISQTMCSKDLQTGHLEHVNRSQKSPKSKTEKGLHDSSSHKKENQPWEVMSDLHGLPKVLTRDSTLQIRTPPPDFESPNLDYSEERSYDIDMIEECERQHCVKMNNNLEKKRPNHYICEEAELSVKSGEEVSEDEEDNSEPNTSDESFVDDNTELTQDEKIDMKAVYLQSVKSPEGLQNKRSVGDAYLDVLSQPDVDDFCSDNDADSFVVSNDCIEYDTEYMGDDMLAEDTIMQKAAAEDLDYKKVGTGTGKGKRRRIILQDSTDCTSEEEANHSSINVKPKGNVSGDNQDSSSSSSFTSPVKLNIRDKRSTPAIDYFSSSPVVSPVEESSKGNVCNNLLGYSSSSPTNIPVKMKQPCKSLNYLIPAVSPIQSMQKEQELCSINPETSASEGGLVKNRYEVKDSIVDKRKSNDIPQLNKLSRTEIIKAKLSLVDSNTRVMEKNQSFPGKISQPRHNINVAGGDSQRWDLSQNEVFEQHEDENCRIPFDFNRGSKANKVKIKKEVGSDELFNENCKPKGVAVSPAKSENFEVESSQDFMSNNSQEMTTMNTQAAREARLVRQKAKQKEFRLKYALNLKQQNKSPVVVSSSDELTSSQESQGYESPQKKLANFSSETNTVSVDSAHKTAANFSLGFSNSDTGLDNLQDFGKSSSYTRQYKVEIKKEVGSDELFHENCKPKGITGSPAKSEASELGSSQDFISNSQEMTTVSAQAAREARLAKQRAKQEEFKQKYALKLKQQNKSPVVASTSDELTSSQEFLSQEHESLRNKSANYSLKANIVSAASSQNTLANFNLDFSSPETGLENLQNFGDSSSHTKQYMGLAHSAASTSSAKSVFTTSLCAESLNDSAVSVKDSDQNFLILVDSCEVNGGGSQVISTLRIKYKACTEVVQLGHADYAVSRRMGVWRQSLSAFSSSSNKTMLISKVQKMLELFERPVLIVEKEPTRPNETPKTMTRTKYLDSILCAFCQVGQMKVLHSTGHSETASLVWELAKVERTKGYHLSISATVVSKLSQIINFYKCLPQISYASAVFLTYTFPNVADFMSCSVIQLQQKTGWSRQRVVAVHQFLHRIFREDMLPS